MVFSTNILKTIPQQSLNSNNQKIFEEVSSFFSESLLMIQENDKIINAQLSNHFLLEGSDIIFKKLMSKIDFKAIIRKIFKIFIDLMEKLWNQFRSLLVGLFSHDKVIKNFKEDLQNIKISVYYPEERYSYSDFKYNTNLSSFKFYIEKELTDLIMDLTEFNQYKTKDKIYSKIESMKEEIQNSEEYYNSIRATIIQKRNSVEKQNFATELFNYFRNGGNIIPASEIRPNEMKNITEGYFNFKKTVKEIEKDKTEIQQIAKKTDSMIQKVDINKYTNISFSEEAMIEITKVIQGRCIRVKNICDMFVTTFAAKLDAVKESIVQNKNILYLACKRLIKEGLA